MAWDRVRYFRCSDSRTLVVWFNRYLGAPFANARLIAGPQPKKSLDAIGGGVVLN
jgi:hypothetical protein